MSDDTLTLRDQFAIATLPALVDRQSMFNDLDNLAEHLLNIGESAYEIADAMLQARAKNTTAAWLKGET